MKKQSCRMTQQERETHREATKLRKMTDQQLVDYVNSQKEQAGPAKDQEAVHKAEIEELEAEVAKYKAKANKAEVEARKNAENAGRDTGCIPEIRRISYRKLRTACNSVPDPDGIISGYL